MQELFKDCLSSFYSRPFYASLARKGDEIGAGYVAILSLFMMLTLLVPATAGYPQFKSFADALPAMAEKLPAVNFDGQKLSIDKPSPYKLELGTTGEHLVIDTNYQVTDVEMLTKKMHDERIVILVTENSIAALKEQRNSVEIHDLKEAEPFSITHDDWMKWADILKTWGASLLFLFGVLGGFVVLFIYNMFATLLSAVFVKVVSLIVKSELKFAGAMRIAAAARIPVQVIVMSPILIGASAIAGALSWVLWLGYMVFAVVSSKQQA